MTDTEWERTLPPYITAGVLDGILSRALAEDIGQGDLTTEWTVSPTSTGRAALIAKENGIFAGAQLAQRLFELLDPGVSVTWERLDGDSLSRGDTFGYLQGPLRAILTGERVMLNFMQRMSGIATRTHAYVRVLEGTTTRILDTRKTVPGLRHLDKWAVLIGGGVNHRLDLSDEIMIKENHIQAAGGLAQAIRAVAERNSGIPVVVEIERLEQIDPALATGAVDRLLLDNMVKIDGTGSADTSMLAEAVRMTSGRAATEASGNITLATAGEIARTGVDYISVGELTHSVRALDISLLIQ